MRRLAKILLAAAAGWFAFRARAAVSPAAYPYWGRALLKLPRPWITRRRLVDILEPRPGERVLELGPGTGYYTVTVADALGPNGRLDILDISQRYLDHTMGAVRARGLTGVVPALGDGGSLPYPDASFDAAYLVTVIGEIPDPQQALRELRRVLKPGGRLVLGETLIDPDYSRLSWLARHARDAGLELERRVGTAIGYFARFEPTIPGPVAGAAEEVKRAAGR